MAGDDILCYAIVSCMYSNLISKYGVLGCHGHASCINAIIESTPFIFGDGAYGLLNGIFFYLLAIFFSLF